MNYIDDNEATITGPDMARLGGVEKKGRCGMGLLNIFLVVVVLCAFVNL